MQTIKADIINLWNQWIDVLRDSPGTEEESGGDNQIVIKNAAMQQKTKYRKRKILHLPQSNTNCDVLSQTNGYVGKEGNEMNAKGNVHFEYNKRPVLEMWNGNIAGRDTKRIARPSDAIPEPSKKKQARKKPEALYVPTEEEDRVACFQVKYLSNHVCENGSLYYRTHCK